MTCFDLTGPGEGWVLDSLASSFAFDGRGRWTAGRASPPSPPGMAPHHGGAEQGWPTLVTTECECECVCVCS